MAAVAGDELPEYLRVLAEEELGETKEARENGLSELRRRITTDFESPDPSIKLRTDDVSLLRFLRVSKFNLDKAFERVERYFEGRKRYLSVYQNVPLEKMKRCFLDGSLSVSQIKTDDHRTIVTFSMGKWD